MRLRFRLVDLLTMVVLLGVSLGQLGRWDPNFLFVLMTLGVPFGVLEVRLLTQEGVERTWLRAGRIVAGYFLPVALAGQFFGLLFVVIEWATRAVWHENLTRSAVYAALGAMDLGLYVGLRLLSRPPTGQPIA